MSHPICLSLEPNPEVQHLTASWKKEPPSLLFDPEAENKLRGEFTTAADEQVGRSCSLMKPLLPFLLFTH